MLLEIFLVLNIIFLLGTAIWFRLDHASKQERFVQLLQDDLVDEVQWQYSLRSNLLIWGCMLSTYILYIGHGVSLLVMFAIISTINVITDHFYQYPGAPIFHKAKTGHIYAEIVICSFTIIYLCFIF